MQQQLPTMVHLLAFAAALPRHCGLGSINKHLMTTGNVNHSQRWHRRRHSPQVWRSRSCAKRCAYTQPCSTRLMNEGRIFSRASQHSTSEGTEALIHGVLDVMFALRAPGDESKWTLAPESCWWSGVASFREVSETRSAKIMYISRSILRSLSTALGRLRLYI